ncbi:MAG: NAD(P)H-dependent oxidoreductase [Candidatus Magnetoovum sp. WYHC-5]|nr:NAD(P)H-dependent oxidoreductase [Candidatus Magnetoovum sp. WYHC-5]
MKDEILKTLNFRHACKLFDEMRKIPKEDLLFILEAGRLSPSSFGLEQWKFIVVQSKELKEALQTACFNQMQLSTCSDDVAILAKIEALHPDGQYVNTMLKRFGYTQEFETRLFNVYKQYYNNTNVLWWSIAQCHIAAANMMTAAASIGIDSCPIGAFEPLKVREVLGYDPKQYEIALIVPFGYRKNPQPAKNRLSFEEVVEFR